jgi:Cu/Ag efflux pump CusA
MLNRLIKWSLDNRLIVIVLGLILFIFGSFSAINTPVDVLPEFAPPQVVIQTHAPGYAAEEVEALVTIPLESALNGIANIRAIRSNSIEGLSFVTVVFEWGHDVYRARQLVSEKTQQVAKSFPVSIKTPILSPITSPIGFTYFFALTSKSTS